MGWLKAEASDNIRFIFATADTFHSPIGWLKAKAWLNMPSIVVTVATLPFTNGLVENRGLAELVDQVRGFATSHYQWVG